jgi:arylsulfatase A-like enzyme
MASAGLLFSMITSCSEPQDREQRPNFIFIMADDHANRTISAYDGSINQTPNIDRLAEEGAIFTQSFNANSICAPSRASILTGKHSHRNGVTGNGAPWNNEQFTFPGALKESGYETILMGKWHLNSLPGDGFDYYKVLTGAGNQGFYYNPEFNVNGKDTVTEKGYSTDIITEESIEWLQKLKNRDNPFMLFVQYKAPHVPRMPHFRYLDKYKDDTIPEPATLFDDYDTRLRYAEEANMSVNYRPLPPLEEHDPSSNIYFDRMTREQFEKYHSFKDPVAEKFRELKEKGELQGRSFKTVLEGKTPSDWRNSIYYHYYDHGRHNVPRHEGIRTEKFKLIHFYTEGKYEFYDLKADPHEINNLYKDEEYADTVKMLKDKLDSLRKHYKVPEKVFHEPYVPFSGIGDM